MLLLLMAAASVTREGMRRLIPLEDMAGTMKFLARAPRRLFNGGGGGGESGRYRGFDEWLGVEVAWNQVRLHDVLQSPGDLEHLYCEIHLLGALRHRAVMRLRASWVDAPRRTVNFITELFSSGTLRQYREKHRRVSMAAVKRWCRQILDGVAYLHGHDPPVIHRDLKCDNIFVNGSQGEVKIGDLGLATVRRPRAAHCVGTPEFMAPEVYGEAYDELADVYSFGMCVLEMVTLEYPYSECTTPVQIYKKVVSGIKPAALHKVRDPAARWFIDRCLAPASERPAARELLDDPFLLVGDGGFCSGDGDNYNAMYDHLHKYQPSCPEYHHAYSNGGSTASNGLSNSVNGEDTPSRDRSACDDGGGGGDDESRFHGFDEHGEDDDEGVAGVGITIKGRRTEDGGVFLRLRMADGDGRVGSIYFPFDAEADTALSVAAEMVAELDITDHEVTRIAEMIDGEVGALVPDWRPGPGMDDNGGGGDDDPDASSGAACRRNCPPSSSSRAASSSSGGSLLEFMSSPARRGCRCSAELHGRFEEITFQADEERARFQCPRCSSDDGGSQVEHRVIDTGEGSDQP